MIISFPVQYYPALHLEFMFHSDCKGSRDVGMHAANDYYESQIICWDAIINGHELCILIDMHAIL